MVEILPSPAQVVTPDFKQQDERKKALGQQDKSTYQLLKGQRGTWDAHWQQIAQVCMPNARGFNSTETPGRKNMERVFDSTPIWANEQLAGGLHGTMVNPFQRWFQLNLEDKFKARIRDVKIWVDSVEDAVYNVFSHPVSNFNSQSHSMFLDLTAFGTGPLFIEPILEDPGIRFTALPLRSTFLAEGANGLINRAYLEILLTPVQVLEIYGEENVSPDMLVKAQKQPFVPVTILHSIYPRTSKRNTDSPANIDKPFASNHMELDTGWVLRESGFDFFPILAPRWIKRSGETYGRSPAMTALPDANLLNEQMRTDLRARQKVVDPPLLVPDDGILGPIRTAPSSLNYFRTGMSKDDFIRPLETKANIAVSNDGMEQTRERILRAFFLDRFKLQKENVEMTRAEAEIRKQEDLQQLSPTVGRLETELLNPLIDLTIQILQKDGRLPPPPPQLNENDFISIEYVSAIARAQKSDEANSVLQSIDVLTPLVQVDPSIMDNFDLDAIARRTQQWFGTPEVLYSDPEEMEALRQGRAQQAAQEQQQQSALSDAQVAKDMATAQSQVPV